MNVIDANSTTMPPMDYEAWREQLLTRLSVRSPSDRDLLLEIYARTLERAFGHVETIKYDRLGWGSLELAWAGAG